MGKWLFLFGIFLSQSVASAVEQKTYTVGTQSISFKPHYDFTSPEIDSYAEAILQLFASEQHIQFKFVPLPVKRLNVADGVDFIYPDNPQWRQVQNYGFGLYFSQPLIHNLGGTMVLAAREQMPVSAVKTVAVVRGFTPDHLLKIQPQYQFKLVETSNAESALRMVLKGRVDAADVEMNVANHLLTQIKQPKALVPGTALPFVRVGFHLSTSRHPELLQALDRFLLSHAHQIEQLKKHYQLQESWPVDRSASK